MELVFYLLSPKDHLSFPISLKNIFNLRDSINSSAKGQLLETPYT